MTDKPVSALEDWNDPHGCQDVSTAQDVIDELQARVQELEKGLNYFLCVWDEEYPEIILGKIRMLLEAKPNDH